MATAVCGNVTRAASDEFSGFAKIKPVAGTVAADISLAVIHKRAKRPGTARRSELVNNCAAGENFAGERPAPARSQSQSPHPKRVIGRLLAEPEALAPTSDRKTPPEGRYISKMDGRAKRRKNRKEQKQTMNDSQQWQQHRAFGALDWASAKHSVVLVNQTGKVIEDFEIEHSALGWKKFREKLRPYGSISFSIETRPGVSGQPLFGEGKVGYSLQS